MSATPREMRAAAEMKLLSMSQLVVAPEGNALCAPRYSESRQYWRGIGRLSPFVRLATDCAFSALVHLPIAIFALDSVEEGCYKYRPLDVVDQDLGRRGVSSRLRD